MANITKKFLIDMLKDYEDHDTIQLQQVKYNGSNPKDVDYLELFELCDDIPPEQDDYDSPVTIFIY